jgi:hypothetical protein
MPVRAAFCRSKWSNDPAGKALWEQNAGDAQWLPNGATLNRCGIQKRVIEVTPDKKIAWEIGAKDAPPFRNLHRNK